jgi:carboxyl-terminal processing protease
MRPYFGRIKLIFRAARFFLIGFLFVSTHASQTPSSISYLDEKYDNSKLQANSSDQRIAEIVTRILEQHHFVRQQLDDAVSKRFLSRYLDNLDPMRIHFLQEDIETFNQKYGSRLDELTRRGDTSPAYEIYRRFLDRLNERVQFVRQNLEKFSFDFSTNEKYNPDRRNFPYPANKQQAETLWLNRLKYEVLQERLADLEKDKIVEKLLRRYSRILRMARETEPQDILGIYLSSLTQVYDPHSEYLNASRLDSFEINMRLSLSGIGAVLGSEDGYCVIRELVPGGPAENSGLLKPGDKIVGVAQQDEVEFTDVVDMHLNKVVNLIRGEPGSRVRLLISPADSKDSSITKEITLTRDHIKITQNEAKASIIDLPTEKGVKVRVGVIDLPSFYGDPSKGYFDTERKSTTQDVRLLINRLKKEGIQGLVLDLRRNGGGYLEEAINLTGLFIPPGPAVQVQDARGRVEISRTKEPKPVWDGPLVLLLSRFSASASEILANALKDHGRAVLVGDLSTHGKGTVQTLIDIDNILDRFGRGFDAKSNEKAGGLKITVQKFYGPDGSSTQLRGVTPDIVLPSVNDYLEIGEASLQDPLPWDVLPPAYYKKTPRFKSEFLPILRAKSAERVSKNPDFKYISEDIEQLRAEQKDKSISLNEEVRRKERQKLKQQMELRDKERRERISKNVHSVTFITLADLEKNTLPEPVLLTAGTSIRPFHGDLFEDESTEGYHDENKTKKPQFDPTLWEAQNILADLVLLTQQHEQHQTDTTTLAANPQTPKKRTSSRLE